MDLTEKIKNCPVSLEHRPSQRSQPLRSHEISLLPWAKVGTDLLQKKSRNYLVTIDYYSKWPELTLIPSMTSTGVIKYTQVSVCKVWCALSGSFRQWSMLQFCRV